MSTVPSTKTKVFILEHTVYFNETNAVGGVAYFSNYVKWQGMTREEYFMRTVPEWREIVKLVSQNQINMITVEEHSHFNQHAFFGDKVIIRLQTSNIKRYSFDMIFIMINANNEQVLYEGFQRLAFDDFKGKFIEIPKPMLDSVKEHEMNLEDLKESKLAKYFINHK